MMTTPIIDDGVYDENINSDGDVKGTKLCAGGILTWKPDNLSLQTSQRIIRSNINDWRDA